MRLRSLAAAALILGLAAGQAAASPSDPAAAASDLSSDRWEVRRAAEIALHAEGLAMLEGAGDAARAKAWEEALDGVLAHGGHGAREAVRRVLRRLEAQATDDQVRRLPRLLRSRLDRMLPQLVIERARARPFGRASDSLETLGAAAAATAVFGLLPEARDQILATIATAEDPRVLAGAVVASCSEEGHGPESDAVLDALLRAFDAAPARVERMADYVGARGTLPIAALELALAMAGRSEDLSRLRERLSLDGADDAFDGWLRERVGKRGLGELSSGSFLARLEGGLARAEVEADAARRALEAGVPWLARLLAGRALFLDARRGDARAVLVAAYERVGLKGLARKAEGKAPAADDTDDPAARRVEDGIAAGRLSERKVLERDAGDEPVGGLVPAVLANGRLVHGTTKGHVKVVDIATGAETADVRTLVNLPPRALVVSGSIVAAVTARGGAWFWALEDGRLNVLSIAGGPFLTAAAGKDGDIWLMGVQRTIYKSRAGAATELVAAIKPVSGLLSGAFSATDDGKLVVYGRGAVSLLDPSTGDERVLVAKARAPRRAVAFGRDALVSFGEHWERVGADGKIVSQGVPSGGGPITGLGGDASAGVVYVVQPEAVDACDATTGEVRWSEPTGGSGDPFVDGDLLVLSAGTGPSPSGDHRATRTIAVLRTGVAALDPFSSDARVKAVESAVAAAREGRFDVAESLLDPLAGWFSRSERWAADQAVAEARQKRRAADLDRGMDAGEPAMEEPPAMDEEPPAMGGR